MVKINLLRIQGVPGPRYPESTQWPPILSYHTAWFRWIRSHFSE